MRFRKSLSIILGLVLLSSLILGGCSQKNSKDETITTTTQAIAAETTQTQKAPDEISIFYGTAGIKAPEGIKLDDNAYLNKIAELANVKFKEVIVPEYADFQTKFSLMVSSGSIPDLVHCSLPAGSADVQTHGEAGAFMELGEIIANSSVLSKKYTPNMINLMKNENNKIFALRTLPPKDAQAAGIRMDLLDEINEGKIPVTPNEWYEAFKKLKAKYPDSVPYSGIGLNALHLFFKSYGVDIGNNGAEWQYKDGKIISAFEAPMSRDSILYHKKLYDEGLLDRTFATNKAQDFLDRKWNKQSIIAPNNLNSVIAYIPLYINNNVKGAIFAPGPLPRVDDTKVADADVYTEYDLLGGHCVAIGASTQKKDAAVRLIETFLSDEVMELTSWGLKDVDYTVEGNEKKAAAKASDTLNLRKMYSFMFTYGSEDNVAVTVANSLALIDPSIKDKYVPRVTEGMKITYDQAAKVKPNPKRYIQLGSDSQLKIKEANELSKTIIIKAIIGEISMEEYDKQVSEYLQKYKFITDEYNAKLPAMEAKLK